MAAERGTELEALEGGTCPSKGAGGKWWGWREKPKVPCGVCKQPDLGITRRRKSFCLLRGQRHLVATKRQYHAAFLSAACSIQESRGQGR